MTAARLKGARWNTLAYQQIVSAAYDGADLVVGFADGAVVRVPPLNLLAADSPAPDWTRLTVEEFHLGGPSPAGDVEIPWDVIRVQTDPAFDAYWAELATERAVSVSG
jgi:hypothetical protein